MTLLTERRKYRRYRAIDGIITMLGFPSKIMGSILDMSHGGLSFQYIVDNEPPYESMELDILYTDKLIYIDKVPFKAVFDIDICDGTSSALFPLRRCGVKFGELTNEQKGQLEHLILNYTKKNNVSVYNE
ncbi:MAG: PilZ domain-containing protein [Desulfobacteraceae bacterium]|nr:PilZ domain-containing protein [Desulfobacteraceae bacterium]